MIYAETCYRIINKNANLKIFEIFCCVLLEFYVGY